MKKINLLIAALHAGALALVAAPGMARAQDAQEIRAYMQALSLGTAEALSDFLTQYPNSALPGSELGASIAAGVEPPTASVTSETEPTGEGLGGSDDLY
jgi:hypothetical protein